MAEPAHRAYSKAEISILNAFGGRNIVAIGESGHGKSSLLNRLLSRAAAELKVFVESDNPESETKQTVGCPGYLCGDRSRRIVVIDTPGINDSRGFDARNMEEMAEYLRGLSGGLHAVILVLNVHNSRFDGNMQKVIRILTTIFPTEAFWRNVCIVYTKSFDSCIAAGQINRDEKRQLFGAHVQDLLRKCGVAAAVNTMSFFVDSHDFASQNTREELDLFNGWLVTREPVTTADVQPGRIEVRETEKRVREVFAADQVSIKSKLAGGFPRLFGAMNHRIVKDGTKVTLVEEEREKITSQGQFGENTTYGDWRELRRWEEHRK
eukprot:m.97256 g.97256  ORF g.97256 m.97256 type:complete len:322 (+) comp8659_c0_seq2:314-1279(+)